MYSTGNDRSMLSFANRVFFAILQQWYICFVFQSEKDRLWSAIQVGNG